jgi:pyrimidine-nucleoside phosphorylase
MIVPTLIERKRHGQSLTEGEWQFLVRAYTAGDVPDYQMAALLMAVVLRGLDDDELGALTDAMCASGKRLEFGDHVPPRVDKHSTGGVGDKVSIVLAPLVASMGVAVPMISGRGLSHTGGTLDKLQAIPGFRVDLSLAATRRQVERIGAAMVGQTAEIAPADQKLYALRDVTATVDAIPLMAASIMSKKLAEGLNGLVLDIKRGGGAFVPELDRGLALASTMIRLGEERGCPTVALLTAMDRPLGHACGNALEIAESVEMLRGDGPADLCDVVLALGAEMLLLAGIDSDRAAASSRLRDALASGRAAEKFAEIVQAQGGDPAVIDRPELLPRAPLVREYRARAPGYVHATLSREIGRAVVALGGGRQTIDDEIDPAVGIVVPAKPGDLVERDDVIAIVHARDESGCRAAMAALDNAVRIGSERPDSPLPLVSHRVTAGGVASVA